jgi:16S rRNA (uracil1498-N3)-methyltransferase
MHRFFLPSEQCREPSITLTGREAHHAQHVVRVRRGERVAVLDGAGLECLCEVRGFDRDSVRLALIEKRIHPAPSCRVTLVQAVPKGKIMEAIIQKATELGASRIVPLLSERVVPQLEDNTSAHKAEKWRLVAIEATKQSGSAWLPAVEPPLTLNQVLARGERFEMSLVASLQSGSRRARDYFRAFHAKLGRMPQSVSVWVGPEGDFTPAETDLIKANGVLPITLGHLTLRTETAAIYCLSVLSYEFQSPHTEEASPVEP